MTIFEALRQEHEIQRDLIDKLIKTEGKTEERKKKWAEEIKDFPSLYQWTKDNIHKNT